MRKRKQESTGDAAFGAPLSPRLTPADVQQKEFRLAFRGYNERDVDAFLDHVTEEIGAYIDENRGLREQLAARGSESPVPAAEPSSAAADPAAVEEVLAAARDEAARIVAEARDEADQILAASAGARGGAETRTVIAPFLSRERDFLQKLGRLVQDHAESIRGMVQSARDGRGPEATSAEQRPARKASGETPEGASGESSPPDPITLPEAETDDRTASTDAETPTTVRTTAEPGQDEDPGRSRSLRELFWGED